MSQRPAVIRPLAEHPHPQVQAFLDEALPSEWPPLHSLTPGQARAQVDLEVQAIAPGPSVARVSEAAIDVGGETIAAWVYAPTRSEAEIVWFHGGGWVVAGLDSHDAMCRTLANEAHCTVTSVDYRLAPEHPFPIPLEDCWRALQWVADRASSRPLIVGGDSAGGNLAAVCALRARDRAGPALSAQVLVYPVTDCDMTTASYEEYGGDEEFLTKKDMAWFFDHYVPDPEKRESPDVSPLRAPSLAGLPPAVVVTAGLDPLLDEDLSYIARLDAAGVPVTHRHYGDMTHAFFPFVSVFDRAAEAIAQVGQDLAQTVGRASRPTSRTWGP
ncbi:MAG TPA: alpha/beta hydrolase [Solirubrobacteraceae bacterium]|nr:alpha/beta hydrolase [Solirubrobacteraceae bacterium]